MAQNENGLEKVLKVIVLVILAVVALKVVAGILAVAWVLGGFLLGKVLPLVLLIWLVMKLVEWYRGRNDGYPSPDNS